MKTVFLEPGQRVPVKIWAERQDVEVQAITQLKNIASLPFVFKHVAAMPDVHLGIGATVGSVVATQGAIIPAAVGVDIGCGMMAVKIGGVDPRYIVDRVAAIRSVIESRVPVGHLGNHSVDNDVLSWYGWKRFEEMYATKCHKRGEIALRNRALNQLGTLGGGNHFIELCLDTDGQVWIMLHSGSRNIGKVVAEIHIDKAKDLMKKMFITNLPDPDLAYFAEQTIQFDRYMNDLSWCQDYAMMNRAIMMNRIMNVIHNIVPGAEFSKAINCHHNYASREYHYGNNVIVTRKGAVRARQGEMGIIPGSMGAKSFIVEGLGSQESFHSCSHGAGRKMSRNEARKHFTISDLEKQTEGVDCRKDDGVLDEIPGAYKDIDVVMNNQKDLVRVVAQLKQFMCIKG